MDRKIERNAVTLPKATSRLLVLGGSLLIGMFLVGQLTVFAKTDEEKLSKDAPTEETVRKPYLNNKEIRNLVVPLHEQDVANGNLDGFERLFINNEIEFKVRDDLNPANRQFFLSLGTVRMLDIDGGKALSGVQLGNPIVDSGWPSGTPSSAPTLSRWGVVTKAAKPGPGPVVPPILERRVVQYLTSNFPFGVINYASLDFEIYASKSETGSTYNNLLTSSSGRFFAGGSRPTGTTLIRQLYVHYDEFDIPTLVAYAPVEDSKGVLSGYMRMSLRPEGDTGRISNRITFQSMLEEPTYFNFVQGVHADLAGTHQDTATYSVGNDGGIYMEVSGKGPRQGTPDNTPYRLYYFTDGYDNQPDAAEYTGNIDHMKEYLGGNRFNYDSMAEGYPEDPGPNQRVKTSNHPAYAWNFKARQLTKGDTYDMRLDQAVTSEEWKATRQLITRYLDEAGNPIEDELTGEVEKGSDIYATDPKTAYFEAKGWVLDTTRMPENATGTIGQSDEPIIVEYYYKDHRENNLIVKFQDLGGNKLAEDQVTSYKFGQAYTADAKNLSAAGWTLDNPVSPQTGTMGTDPIEVIFNYRKGQVTVVTEYYQRSQDGSLTTLFPTVTKPFDYHKEYQTVSKKEEALALDLVLESDNTGDPVSGITGDKDETLTIKYIYTDGIVSLSVPSVIDFGDNNLIAIGVKDIVPTENIKVSIVDQLNGKWDLMLGISEDIVSDVDESNIQGEFRFIKNDGTLIDITNVPNAIYSKEVVEIIDGIELEWETTERKGLIFKQFPGNLKGSYSGKLTWILKDAP